MTERERARFIASFQDAMRERCGRPIYGSYGAKIGECASPLQRAGIAVNGGQLALIVTCPTCDRR